MNEGSKKMKRRIKMEKEDRCVICGQNRLVREDVEKSYTNSSGEVSKYTSNEKVNTEDNVLDVVVVREEAENYHDWFVNYSICEHCIEDIVKLQKTVKYMKENNVVEMTTEF
jgi:hypothetical protein